MQREKVILIAANPSQLQVALQFLALDRIALLAILMEDSSRNLAIGEMQLPVYPFSVLGGRLQTSEDTWWLICGWKQRIKETGDIASFMRKRGIPKGRIVNFSYGQALYPRWVANLRYAENHPIHAFATGISYTEVGLDWKEFENVHSGGGVCKSGMYKSRFAFRISDSKACAGAKRKGLRKICADRVGAIFSSL